jgi:hypothetical protein
VRINFYEERNRNNEKFYEDDVRGDEVPGSWFQGMGSPRVARDGFFEGCGFSAAEVGG